MDRLDGAASAVLVPSSGAADGFLKVSGPRLVAGDPRGNVERVLAALPTTGYQATNLGKAIGILRGMLEARAEGARDEELQTTVYLGVAANLFATGCREGVRHLVQHRLVDVLVVSGGAMEHDIRRAVAPHAYAVSRYASEQWQDHERDTAGDAERIGNVRVKPSPEYDAVMLTLLGAIADDQAVRRAAAAAGGAVATPMDERRCTWRDTPSEVWRQVGLGLARHIGRERAETSVAHWAALHGIPIFSPSFADGDITGLIQNLGPSRQLGLDLVGDINQLNRTALHAKRSGMLILGGGVVKHHVCNANLMRNGADWTVFVNNGQEFDGSDAGARPDEAVSWGKIRLDGTCCKVYGEISTILPLLIFEACKSMGESPRE